MKLKIFTLMLCISMLVLTLTSCTIEGPQPTDTDKTLEVAKTLAEAQPTPADIVDRLDTPER